MSSLPSDQTKNSRGRKGDRLSASPVVYSALEVRSWSAGDEIDLSEAPFLKANESRLSRERNIYD